MKKVLRMHDSLERNLYSKEGKDLGRFEQHEPMNRHQNKSWLVSLRKKEREATHTEDCLTFKRFDQ